MEDQQIVELYWNRDEDAILHTQKKYATSCYVIANNILNNPQDAEECVNDAYLKLWNSIPPERPKSLYSFLSRIVRNISLDRHRHNRAEKRNHEADLSFSELEECLSEDEVMVTSDDGLRDALNGFLKMLDQDTRLLFVRRYWYMDSHETLARMFSCSERAVRQRLYRVREKLKMYLREEGIGI